MFFFFEKRLLILIFYYATTQATLSFTVKARKSQGQPFRRRVPLPRNPLFAPRSSFDDDDRLQRKKNRIMNAKNHHHLLASRQNLEDDDNRNPSRYTNLDDDDDDDGDDEQCEVIDDMGCIAIEDRIKNDEEDDTRWIRVEKGPDQEIQRFITRQDVVREIERVRQVQAKAGGRSDLYSRTWQDTGFKRPSRPVINGEGKKTSISVMQFNTLAEGLSSGCVPTPFPKVESTSTTEPSSSNNNTTTKKNGGNDSNDHEFGGFTKIKSPEVCLDFSLRRWRLVEVMLQQYISRPNGDESSLMDIIGLQEVDRFHGFFAPILKLFGYEALFAPKPLAPGVRFGWYSDGCALFWKTSTFELVSERRYEYVVGNQVMLLATLRHRTTKKLLVVAVTHLKAQMNPTNELIRCAQVEELLQCVTEAVQQAAQLQQQQQKYKSGATSCENIPILILGDFNADPPGLIPGLESSVRKMLQHRIKEGAKTPVQSAYPVDPPKPAFYTTWKTRGSGDTVMRIIDYIFYGGGSLTCTSLLQVPDGDELEEGRLPGLRYPSDHMMIAAKFDF
jgi:endonuclease/exonuclease/phosphatase family metal-dependent hydrolase